MGATLEAIAELTGQAASFMLFIAFLLLVFFMPLNIFGYMWLMAAGSKAHHMPGWPFGVLILAWILCFFGLYLGVRQLRNFELKRFIKMIALAFVITCAHFSQFLAQVS